MRLLLKIFVVLLLEKQATLLGEFLPNGLRQILILQDEQEQTISQRTGRSKVQRLVDDFQTRSANILEQQKLAKNAAHILAIACKHIEKLSIIETVAQLAIFRLWTVLVVQRNIRAVEILVSCGNYRGSIIRNNKKGHETGFRTVHRGSGS